MVGWSTIQVEVRSTLVSLWQGGNLAVVGGCVGVVGGGFVFRRTAHGFTNPDNFAARGLLRHEDLHPLPATLNLTFPRRADPVAGEAQAVGPVKPREGYDAGGGDTPQLRLLPGVAGGRVCLGTARLDTLGCSELREHPSAVRICPWILGTDPCLVSS